MPPFKTGKIDIAALKRDRDQLWAEANEAEREHGESLAFPPEVWIEAQARQDAHTEFEPWRDELANVTDGPHGAPEARKLGADEVIISNEPDALDKLANSLDFILNTVAFVHDLNPLLSLLKKDGMMCLVGLPSEPYKNIEAYSLITKRRQLAGSLIGGIKETQELLDFCAKHKILTDIELTAANKINEAFERMIKGDVEYRFVINIASIS